MKSETILTIIIAITVISYLFEQLLDYINLRYQRKDIPDEVAAFYDREKYVRSLAYHRALTKFSFITSAVSVLIAVFMLVMGGFGWLDNLLRVYIDNEIMLALAFFGILMIASDILTIPFQLYSTFVIEEKYGFNQMTGKTFLSDKLKGYALSAIIGGSLIAVLITLIQRIGPDFWIYFSVIAALFVLFINMFYTSLLLPLFNKLTPLAEGELKDAITSFSKKVNFPIDNVFVIDGSKRSKKANAFFSGIGNRKKIVLYDTLIANHTTDELVAILAHEVGHYKKQHIIKGYFLSVIQIVFTLFVLSLLVFNPEVSFALGAAEWGIHLNLLAFGILFSPISSITGLMMNIYSRKNEYEADAYARQTVNERSLAEALKRLSVDSLSNLYPHPLYVFFHYSHPPLLKRLAALSSN